MVFFGVQERTLLSGPEFAEYAANEGAVAKANDLLHPIGLSLTAQTATRGVSRIQARERPMFDFVSVRYVCDLFS